MPGRQDSGPKRQQQLEVSAYIFIGMCIYIYIYVSLSLYVYIYMYIYIYTEIDLPIYLYLYLYLYLVRHASFCRLFAFCCFFALFESLFCCFCKSHVWILTPHSLTLDRTPNGERTIAGTSRASLDRASNPQARNLELSRSDSSKSLPSQIFQTQVDSPKCLTQDCAGSRAGPTRAGCCCDAKIPWITKQILIYGTTHLFIIHHPPRGICKGGSGKRSPLSDF